MRAAWVRRLSPSMVRRFTGGGGDAAPTTHDAEAARANEPQPPADLLWCGPKKVGPVVFALHGPLQLGFILLAACALVLAVIVSITGDIRVIEIIAAWGFLAVSSYVVWLAKGIYILKWLRLEIAIFRGLNKKLELEVSKLTGQVDELTKQNAAYALRNAEHRKLNEQLSDKVKELSRVEKQLAVLAGECGDSVEQARALIERLERNVKLDTVNTVFQFFDRTDRNKDGRIEVAEVNIFVDNLSMLWQHLPNFDKEEVKLSLIEQGGITLEQVHALVEAMMLQEDERLRRQLENKLKERFSSASRSISKASLGSKLSHITKDSRLDGQAFAKAGARPLSP